MAKITITKPALRDLHDIEEYITTELCNPPAAQNTVDKIKNTVIMLEQFPEMGTPLSALVHVHAERRLRFLKSGSYLIFYRLCDDGPHIIRILNGSTNYMKNLF